MEEFKVGDVVCLKSGGPDMTVEIEVGENHESKGRIRCVWFEKDKRQRDDFRPETLMKNDGGILFGSL